MFELNDMVMYGSHGACKLVDITEKDFGGEIKKYYVLAPADSFSSTFYVPTDSEKLIARIHRVKTAQELRALIAGDITPSEWIENDRARQDYLKQVVESGDTELLISALKALYLRQCSLVEEGKKLRAVDERYGKEIEKLLFEEMSMAFELVKDDLIPALFCDLQLSEKTE